MILIHVLLIHVLLIHVLLLIHVYYLLVFFSSFLHFSSLFFSFLLFSLLLTHSSLPQVKSLPFPVDPERFLDDWVFLCFFVGNDFLPHIPSLEIRENAVDMLVEIYRNKLPELGGYLTEGGEVNVGRVERVMVEVGRCEEGIFQKRRALGTAKRWEGKGEVGKKGEKVSF